MKKISLIIFITIAAIISSCSDYEGNSVESDNDKSKAYARISKDTNRANEALREFAGDEFQTTVLAEIQDIKGNPLAGVEVAIGESRTFTNNLGIAFIPNAVLKDKFAYVTAKKAGYFDGSRAFIPNNLESGVGNQVKIKLFRMDSPTTIDSEGQSIVSVNTPYGNGSITFSGGFIDENGNAYNGPVNVYTAYIDPLNPDTAHIMPGDLLGLSTNNEISVLGTFGMVNVELRGDSGQELQIVNPAKIRLPISNNQLADAPDEIPMWYFNETSGLWIEEGIGDRQGNEYVAVVNHFTTWNCDIGLPVAFVTIHVKDQFGNPIQGAIVDMTSSVFNLFGLTTPANGILVGSVPTTAVVNIIANGSSTSCSTTSFNNSFSFPTQSQMYTVNITLNISNPISYSIIGTLYDCAGAPLATPNGWVGMMYNGSGVLLPTNASGVYSHTFTSCTPPNVSIIGFNRVANATTPTSTITPTPGATTHNINFPPCLSEYIEYSIDGAAIKKDDINPGGGFTGINSFQIQAEDSSSNVTRLVSQTTSVGFGYTYGSGPGQLEFTSLADSLWTGSTNHTITFNITNIGFVGSAIEVTFMGTFDDSSGNPHTISGSAYILRDF